MALTGLIILIADRNPNIRSLIMRELKADGYDARSAGSASELLYHISETAGHSVLIILDPDLPDAEYLFLEKILNERVPPIPVIIHALNSDFLNHDRFHHAKEIIEKADKSIDVLKKTVSRVSEMITSAHVCEDMLGSVLQVESSYHYKGKP